MEYSFRNSPMGERVTVVLSTFTAIVRRGSKEEYIPYANITSVRLSRLGKGQFRLYLYQDSLDPVLITNKNFDSMGRPIDQSKSYHALVTMLHRHLTDKSHAEYSAGSSPFKVVCWGLVFLVLSFIIAFGANSFGLNVTTPVVEAAVLFVVLATGSLFLFGNIPKQYSPTDIPLQFLP